MSSPERGIAQVTAWQIYVILFCLVVDSQILAVDARQG